MNEVVLIGRLATTPEVAYTPQNQKAYCRFTLAVNRIRKEDPADFIRIIVWGTQAENCARYLSKGRLAAIQGRITTGSYFNKNQEKVYTTEVTANHVEFLTPKGNSGQAIPETPAVDCMDTKQMSHYDLPESFQAAEDDIPF